MADPEYTDEADFTGYAVSHRPLGPDGAGDGAVEDDDPVVSSMDVYLEQTADLRLMQFPTRPPWRPYSYDSISALEVSPNGQEMFLSFPLDAPRLLEQDEDDERLSALPFVGAAVGGRAGYAAGFITEVGGEPAIVMRPLRDIYVFRPELSHTDKGKDFRQFERVADDPTSLDPTNASRKPADAEPARARGKAVEMYGPATGNAQDLAALLSRPTEYPAPRITAEAGRGTGLPIRGLPGMGGMLLSATRPQLGPAEAMAMAGSGGATLLQHPPTYQDPQAPPVLQADGMVTSQGGISQFSGSQELSISAGTRSQSQPQMHAQIQSQVQSQPYSRSQSAQPAERPGGQEPVTFVMTPTKYFSNLVRPSSITTLVGKLRLRPTAKQQIETIVADRKVIRFRAARHYANKCRDDQECLNFLSEYTVCVRGFFVIKSQYVMPEDRKVYRDYLLLLLALNLRGLSGAADSVSTLLPNLAGDGRGQDADELVPRIPQPITDSIQQRLQEVQRGQGPAFRLDASEFSAFVDEMVRGDRSYFISRNRFTTETGLKASHVAKKLFCDVMEKQRLYPTSPEDPRPPMDVWTPSNGCDGELLILHRDWCLAELNKWLALAPGILQSLRTHRENAFLLQSQEKGALKTLLSPEKIDGPMRAKILETLGYERRSRPEGTKDASSFAASAGA